MYDFSGRVQNVPFEFLRGQYVLERLRKRRLDSEKNFYGNFNDKTFQIFKTEISENFKNEIIKTKEEILNLRSIENNNNYNGMFHTIEKINEEIFNLQENIKEKLTQVNNLEKINKEILKSQPIRSIDRSVRSPGDSGLVALLPIESPDFSNNLRFALRFSCNATATIMVKCNGEISQEKNSQEKNFQEFSECIIFEQTFSIGLYIIEGTITNSYTGLDCTINSPCVESRRLPFDIIKNIELHSVSSGIVVVQESTLFNAETVVFTKHN